MDVLLIDPVQLEQRQLFITVKDSFAAIRYNFKSIRGHSQITFAAHFLDFCRPPVCIWFALTILPKLLGLQPFHPPL